MPVFRYTGPDRTYAFLPVGKDQVAPVTVTDGDLVQVYGDAPADGCWERAPKAAATRLPDNHPDVTAAANEAAAAVDPDETPADVEPPTAATTHDQSDLQATPTATSQE